MNELKPCPFCGGEAAIFQGSDENQHTVRCVQCAIKMPIMLNREGAIEAWNQRAEQDAVPVVRGRWEKDLDTIKCSACGFGIFPIGYFFMNGKCTSKYFRPPYCPNCGAKMESEGST